MERGPTHEDRYRPGPLTTSGPGPYFAAPKDSDEIDGGQLRDFVPAGLRSFEKPVPPSPLYDSSYANTGGLGDDLGLMPRSSSSHNNHNHPANHTNRGNTGASSSATSSTTMSMMSPVFHFLSHDTALVAMEHNNHCKLLALATSKNEVFVTLTQRMPVVEDAAAVMELNGPTPDERLQDWDPAAMTVLVDRLPFPCTRLQWAPWQHGVYLAGICPGKELRLYRYSHGRWALDAALTEPTDCLAFAFSAQFTLACACRQGRIDLLTRSATAGEEKAWALCHRYIPSPPTAPAETLSLEGRNRRSGAAGGGGSKAKRSEEAAATPTPFGDCLAADFDESGSLLAVVDQHAAVRVYGVTHDGTRISHIAFARDGGAGKQGSGGFRQVTWSPSAGRSFLILAVVLSSRIHICFFRRPRHLNAAGMPMNLGRGGSRGSASQLATQLQLLAEKTALCEEVAKLSWNTTGTRFVTSHRDSSVHVWALDVTYQQAQPAPLAVLLQGGGGVAAAAAADGRAGADVGFGASGPSAGNKVTPGGQGGTNSGGGGGATGNTRPDQKLNLVVAIRKVSSVYPYHALNAK